MLVTFILIAALLCSIIIPFGAFLVSKKKETGSFKMALICNAFFFFATMAVASIVIFSGAMSADAATETAAAVSNTEGWRYLAAAISTGLATIGAGIAVSNAASAALGAISEDSSLMGKALIFVALAEGIAIYGILISVMILNA